MTTPSSVGLPHRSVTSIRGGAHIPGSSLDKTPTTPTRTTISSFASPSTIRAEEDLVIVEIGSRHVRVGFAGDNAPKAHMELRQSQQRRTGDYRMFIPGYVDGWRARAAGKEWGKENELWQYDVRDADLGLIEDKLDRILRDAFSRILLIDLRPRRTALVVPSNLPLPLLSTVLDLMFRRFLSPTISLLSGPVMSTVGAGVRAGLIVDLGWNETVVTSVYEYREIRATRSVRAGRQLIEELHKMLYDELVRTKQVKEQPPSADMDHVVSFDEVEDVATKLLWCRPGESARGKDEGLETVEEQDETERDDGEGGFSSPNDKSIEIPLRSVSSHCRLNISFSRLAEVCENVFFERQFSDATFDDEELPVHLLIYNHLLRLPMDIRAVCMARMMFIGGNSRILGLRSRICHELEALIKERGWDPVVGRGPKAYKKNPLLQRRSSAPTTPGATAPLQSPVAPTPSSPIDLRSPITPTSATTPTDQVWHDAANAGPEVDAIDDKIRRGKPAPTLQGSIRVLDTIGPWSGASLACHLKVVAVAAIDREQWLQSGLAGATKASDVDNDSKAPKQAASGGMRAPAPIQEKSWTLGAWGAI